LDWGVKLFVLFYQLLLSYARVISETYSERASAANSAAKFYFKSERAASQVKVWQPVVYV
jgi:hypothetical protein